MKTIHKYQFMINGFDYSIPIGAKFLTAFIQDGDPQMWFEVDANQRLETRSFRVLGTGESMPENENLVYLTTFQQALTDITSLQTEHYIWHLYEIK